MFSVTESVYQDFSDGAGVNSPSASARGTGSMSELEHPLEEEMATHSSALAWEIPWTEEHGGLYSP